MKHQALFSSKDRSKRNKSVVCCNFAGLFAGSDESDTLHASTMF